MLFMIKFLMKPYKKIAITTGDRDGIGFEVTVKALEKTPASVRKNKAIFFIFRHQNQEHTQKRYLKQIDRRWLRLTFDSFQNSLHFLDLIGNSIPDNLLIDLALKNSEADWVLEAILEKLEPKRELAERVEAR